VGLAALPLAMAGGLGVLFTIFLFANRSWPPTAKEVRGGDHAIVKDGQSIFVQKV
jgi:hypothetical protein